MYSRYSILTTFLLFYLRFMLFPDIPTYDIAGLEGKGTIRVVISVRGSGSAACQTCTQVTDIDTGGTLHKDTCELWICGPGG